jgi:polyhydroxybutyrate depolymerase
MTGMSNGAAMTYRYACAGHVRLAAIGPVAGSFSAPCGPVRFTPVMAIHGLDDHNIPFAGGHSVGKPASDVDWLGVERSLEPFRRAGHCSAPRLTSQGVMTTATSACDGAGEVVLITVSGAGHQWPGSERPRAAWLFGLDPVSDAFDATGRLWDFFRAHRAGND